MGWTEKDLDWKDYNYPDNSELEEICIIPLSYNIPVKDYSNNKLVIYRVRGSEYYMYVLDPRGQHTECNHHYRPDKWGSGFGMGRLLSLLDELAPRGFRSIEGELE